MIGGVRCGSGDEIAVVWRDVIKKVSQCLINISAKNTSLQLVFGVTRNNHEYGIIYTITIIAVFFFF